MKEESRIRLAAITISSRFEGSSYHTCRSDATEIIRYGRLQFSLASGALGRIVNQYLERSHTATAEALKPYQISIQQRDPSLGDDETLRTVLVTAGRDLMMQQIQDEEAITSYWEPVKRIAMTPRHLQTPLAWAMLFDIAVNHGIGDGFLRLAEREFGVPQASPVLDYGLTEAQLITRVAELRKLSLDRQAMRERGDFWLNLALQGDWQLQGDNQGNIFVNGAPIQVRSPQAISSKDQLDPTIFYVIPTANRVRVRARPIDGEEVAMLALDDVVEVIESYESAAPKVGVQGEWLHIRSSSGIEGYTAAWFFKIHQKPTIAALAQSSVLDSLLVTPKADQIRIRAWPQDGQILGAVKRGQFLEVLEAPAEAIAKIGVQGQWLQVRTPDGIEGYTAAWFYSRAEASVSPGTAPVLTAAPQPEPLAPTPAPIDQTLTAQEAQFALLNHQKLYVTPTDNRIRVRAQPVSGESVAVVLSGDIVEVLDPYEEALALVGVEGEWLHIRTPDGIEGYTAAWFYVVYDESPPPAPEPQPLYVTPTDDLIRLRSRPVDGEPVDLVSRGDIVTVLEPLTEAENKVGVQDQWLYVQSPSGTEGYVAAWFFTVFEDRFPARRLEANMTGVNLDIYQRPGCPEPEHLGQIGWIRLPYNVSLNPDVPEGHPTRLGNTDLEATYQRYQPVIEGYARAGLKVLLLFTHQTYGDGAGYNWDAMDSPKWRELSDKLAVLASRIAAQYQGQGIVHAYQIWNEMDSHSGARQSVPLPPSDYAYMLTQSIKGIRAADSNALIITGGHASGPFSGTQYVRRTLDAMPADIRPDGIAFHPYGRGDAVSEAKYRPHGHIDDSINSYAGIMPGVPVWITEWGLLDQPGEAPEEVARYASEFMHRLKRAHAHKVAAAIWYAWAETIDGAYGLVDSRGKPRRNLTERFVQL